MRSAGTADGARIQVTAKHLGWADVVFVMEPRHRDLLRRRFGAALEGKRVVCLHVPDTFALMGDDLVDLLRSRLAEHL
ncbi:MAG: protein tyrosine phosphatase [Thermomicrobiales bacterium]